MTPADGLAGLRKARDQINRDPAQPLDMPALARIACMSPGHFARRFRTAYGESPYSYQMARRIERAQSLLLRGDMSVIDICYAVGCPSLGSFTTRFSEVVGESPSTYRARRLAGPAHTVGPAHPAGASRCRSRNAT